MKRACAFLSDSLCNLTLLACLILSPWQDARADDSAQASLLRIPSLMDNLYRYNVNSESDLVTFRNRQTGTLQQVLTFYDENRRLSIIVRDFPDGDWSDPVDIHAQIGNDELEHDSHNSTAFGVAPDGTYFVTANQHVDPLRMAMTSRPWDIHSFVPLPADSIAPKDDDRVTYPSFSYLDEQLFFSYREQDVGGGKARFRWLFKQWNTETRHWDDMAQFNTGVHLRLYVSNIAWNRERSQLHLAAVWRDDRPQVRTRGTSQQHDLFHLYSRDGRQWHQYGEGEVQLPLLWQGAGESTVPELIWNTGQEDPVPANAGSIALDAHSRPHLLNDARGGKLYYHYHDGEQWQSIRDVFRSKSEDLFRLPDGMGAISARGDSVYFHRLTPTLDRKGVLLARGHVTRHFNASVDRGAGEHGWLSMLLTRNQHHPVGSVKGSWPVDAHVLNIPLNRLDEFSTPFIR